MLRIKPTVFFDIDDVLFDTAAFIQSGHSQRKIYRDTEQALENLEKITTLVIFSKGEKKFQKTKLEETGILKFFKKQNVHIFEDKNANLIRVINKYKDSKVYIVDDRLEMLAPAKEYTKQIFTIWMKRGRYAESQKPIPYFTPDAQVENLAEVVRIVRSN